MKIAVWSSWINAEGAGEIIIGIELIKELQKAGHEILVLSQMKTPTKGFLPANVKCTFLSQKQYSLFSIETIKANLQFRKEINTFKPDIILYIGSLWFFVLRKFLTRKDRKIKTIVWEHGNYFSLDKRKILKLIARKAAAKKADQLVVLTQRDKHFYLENCKCKHIPVVIPNFIRSEFINKESKNILHREKQIVFVGRLDKNKQPDKLINIWNSIKAKNFTKEWKLIIVGDGPERCNLQNMITMLKINNIKILGHVKSPLDIYMNSQIMVMTSKLEGLPLVLIEGLFCDLPLIAFDCNCGPADIIDNGHTGFLILEGDDSGFAEKLTLLMANDELRKQFSENTKESRKKFLPESIMSLWEKILNELNYHVNPGIG